jgi:hypothetical protein
MDSTLTEGQQDPRDALRRFVDRQTVPVAEVLVSGSESIG